MSLGDSIVNCTVNCSLVEPIKDVQIFIKIEMFKKKN